MLCIRLGVGTSDTVLGMVGKGSRGGWWASARGDVQEVCGAVSRTEDGSWKGWLSSGALGALMAHQSVGCRSTLGMLERMDRLSYAESGRS